MKGEPIDAGFLRSKGYVRKRCPKCGEYFWTLDPNREICGEAPCEPYTFIGNSTSEKNLEEVREDFLNFFERRGHARINRYPVIARWRDDLFLTSASIVDFQPFITAGIVPPPANPLAISQPCIRLKDIDKVGPTMGRHLSIFEMMAHHAFNTKERSVYWIDRTVELFHEYATSLLGIPEEEITYKEGIWEGGGNAGPDLEPIARGLEIATLVFMQYKVEDGRYVPMDTKVVDTGYGLERITWLIRGDATGFHAVYGNLLKEFMRELGLEEPEGSLLIAYSKVSSLLRELEKGRKVSSLRLEASKLIGINPEVLEEKIAPLERVFSLLDHTKALAFMIADGLVPSNVNEGYLGRLLIRRSLRVLRELGSDIPLSELVVKQAEHWSRKGFPELEEAIGRIAEIVSIEEERYMEAVERGRRVVSDLLRERGGISVEDLIVLYDSHGLPPDMVQRVAESLGSEVEVPDNFFEMIAARHESKKPEPPKVFLRLEELMAFPPTRLLYYQDPYMLEFEAKVLGYFDGKLLLDATAFYPEGGGQPPDLGTIEWDGGSAKVKGAEKHAGRILHLIEGELPPQGVYLRGKVDASRRLSRMRHHTATHILLESARRVLGSHVWQWGAQKGDEESRLDITHYKQVSSDELRRIELLANEIVMRNLPVRTAWLVRTDAERRHGFTLYQGGVVPDPVLRVVEIEGFNAQACGGTHVLRTGEVGTIKVWRARKIQDGVIRLEFSAGLPAVSKVVEMHQKLKAIAQETGVSEEEVDSAVKSILEELRELRRERRRLMREREEELIGKAMRDYERVGAHSLSVVKLEEVSIDEGIKLADKLAAGERRVFLLVRVSGDRAELGLLATGYEEGEVEVGSMVREVAKQLGGGGGGNWKLGKGSVPKEKLDEFLEVLRKRLEGS
ncbi:MAG: alanine--tRNA ligase [Candidatus Korarchaeum sp.]|nr:alanine--tRNA ligase [Candidatus Korarchaeum sp.]MDW8035961.1 alanine--tRNA ligase [Candidatus Korarchaeum sp.]